MKNINLLLAFIAFLALLVVFPSANVSTGYEKAELTIIRDRAIIKAKSGYLELEYRPSDTEKALLKLIDASTISHVELGRTCYAVLKSNEKVELTKGACLLIASELGKELYVDPGILKPYVRKSNL